MRFISGYCHFSVTCLHLDIMKTYFKFNNRRLTEKYQFTEKYWNSKIYIYTRINTHLLLQIHQQNKKRLITYKIDSLAYFQQQDWYIRIFHVFALFHCFFFLYYYQNISSTVLLITFYANYIITPCAKEDSYLFLSFRFSIFFYIF